MEFYFHAVDRDVLVLRVDGGLDAYNSDAFVQDLARVIDAGAQKLLVDCSKLSYISSIGVSVLVRLHKRLAERGGEVKLAAVQGRVFTVLHLVRLDTVFHIYPSVELALDAFRKAQ